MIETNVENNICSLLSYDGTMLQFSILAGGNSGGAFKIDDSGRLMTAVKLDREFKSAYELTIRATDKAGLTQKFFIYWYILF